MNAVWSTPGRVVVVAVALLVGAVGVAGAATAPGSASQVTALVAAAPSITSVPKGLTPPLTAAGKDNAYLADPSLYACTTGSVHEPACVYGDVHGTHTMVLFGDSHAFMWFPALNVIAKAAKWKLVALMNFGCPVADVTVWNVALNQANTTCPTFRSAMIARIDKLDPQLVVMSEGFFTLNASKQPITDAQWTTALEASFAALHAPKMNKVLIGDTILVSDPVACPAAYPTDVQACSKSENNATDTAQRAAEQAAAKQAKVPYVDEVRWTCSKVCTVIVGKMVVYNSAGHLSATYATYLSKVLRAALKPSM